MLFTPGFYLTVLIFYFERYALLVRLSRAADLPGSITYGWVLSFEKKSIKRRYIFRRSFFKMVADRFLDV